MIDEKRQRARTIYTKGRAEEKREEMPYNNNFQVSDLEADQVFSNFYGGHEEKSKT